MVLKLQKNDIIFQRFERTPGNTSKIILNECCLIKAGRIGNDRINISMNITVLQPIDKLCGHLSSYFKYQTYQKFPMDYSNQGNRISHLKCNISVL